MTDVVVDPRERLRQRLAAARKNLAGGPAPIPARPDPLAPAPLSPVQARMWFAAQLEPDSPAYNTSVVLRLHGPLDAGALLAAAAELAERHVVLRSVLREDPDGTVHTVPVPFPAPAVQPATASTVDDLVRAEVSRPYDLAVDPPLRVALWRVGEGEHVLALTVHHIATDAWTTGILLRELAQLYAGERPAAPLQYADVTAWQGEPDPADLDWWEQQLRGLPPVLDLPTDRPRPARPDWGGATLPLDLDAALADRVRAVAAETGTTPFMVLMAALQALLGRVAGTDEFAVGVPEAGRHHPATEGVVGCFINTVVHRADVSGDPTGRELLRRVRDTALETQARARAPFEKVVERVNPDRDVSVSPVFQVMLNVLDGRTGYALPGVEVEPVRFPQATAKHDLTVTVADADGTLTGSLGYRTELWSAAGAEALGRWYVTVLRGLVADLDRPVGAVPLEPVTGPLLAGPAGSDPDRPVFRLIEEQTDRTPGAVAAVGPDGTLTYAELDARANQVAHALLAAGLRPEQTVGVLLEPGTDLVCALLGVQKAGGCYLPMDPVYPPARIASILEVAGAAAVVTVAEFATPGALCLDRPLGTPTTRPAVEVGFDDLAHVIFTSGSTGTPKGVAVAHRSVAHYLAAMLPRLDAAGCSYAMVSTPAADFGLTCVFGALTTGGTVHLVGRETATDPAAFADYLRANTVDVLKCVPSHLELLATHGSLAEVLPRRLLVLAGEACPWSLVERARAARPGLRVQNHYGHTESTMISLVCRTEEVADRTGVVPLGAPIDDVAFFVTDRAGRPLPAGVPGELVITGPGIARGYVGRPDLDAVAFGPDPLDGSRRCYRSGDRVVVRRDGTVEFLGRVDDQVKVRGYRVEPGEVATALRALPGVAEAVVLPVGEGHQRSLAGWVVGTDLDANAVRAALRERLPDYLVPAQLMVLDRLPLNPNGKIDRAALPAPAPPAAAERVAPTTPTEQHVAAVWAEVLKTEVGAEDDFFALGGDSFSAVRVVKLTDPDLRVIDLFTRPTVRALAAYLDSRRPTGGLLHKLAGPRTAAVSVVCVPFGGGSAAAFAGLARELPADHELLAVELPGHDAARPDELPVSIDELVERLAPEIAATATGPVLLYGHCVGSALATALARRLEADGVPLVGLVVAGSFPAARLPGRLSRLVGRIGRDRWISQRFLRDGLLATGGLDGDHDPAATAVALRALRHDFRGAQEWFGRELARTGPKLTAPVLCLVGERDRATDLHEERYAEWGAFAERVERAVLGQAGHYFLRHQAAEVAALLADRVRAWTGGTLPPRVSPPAGSLRTFYTVAGGQFVSTIGTALSGFALGIWAFQRSGRITDLALVVMLSQLPSVLFTPVGGAIADRVDRRRVMLAADAVAAVATAALVALLATDRLALWSVCAIVGVTALTEAVRQPAWLAAVAQLVPKPYLNQANSLANLGPGLSMLVGPLAGGALLGLVGLSGVVAVDVVTFLVGLVTLLAVRFPDRLWHRMEESFGTALLGGWRFVLRRKAILVQVLFFAVVNYFTAVMWVAVTPLVLALSGPGSLGLVTAIGGVGAAVGAVVVLAWGGTERRTIGMVGFVIGSGIGTVLLGVLPSVTVIAVGLFVRLASMTIGNVHGLSIIQVKVGQELQGRVLAVNLMIAAVMQPLGFLTVGPLTGHVFDPLVRDHPGLADALGGGPERGLALFLVASGVFLVLWGIAGLLYRPLRLAEDALPDAAPPGVYAR
jgi:amino acid adenylation domain-containing protein